MIICRVASPSIPKTRSNSSGVDPPAHAEAMGQQERLAAGLAGWGGGADPADELPQGRQDGLAQWPPDLEPPTRPQAVRTQWCHGAPGIVSSLAWLAPGNEELTALLLEGGELAWRAGPLAKGAWDPFCRAC